MSIPDYLRPVPDISTILFPLDEDARNLIEMNYSASACPNIETMAEPPDSPSTSLSKASEYLVKMNQKGYMVMQGAPPEQIRRSFNRSLKPTIISTKHSLPPKPITAPKLTARSSFTSPIKGETPIKLNQIKQKASNPTTTASTTTKFKLDSSVSEIVEQQKAVTPQKKKTKKTEPKTPENTRFKDPELHFFLTSNILKKMKKKISSLPFIIEEDAYVYVNKVEEKIVEIGHRMIHMKMLDSHKLSRSQLQQNTAQFVIEARQVGNDVIRSAFKANLINIEIASQNKDLVREFPEFFPNNQSDKNSNNSSNTSSSKEAVKNGFIPSKSSPLLSNFSSKSFQTQSSNLSTINSSVTASSGIDKPIEFNIAQDEALLRLFDPTQKKSNELPLYYRPDVAELKKPEYGITASSKPSTTLQTKKNLKKIANAYEQVLMRPSTAPMGVHFPNINSPTQVRTEFEGIGENEPTVILNLNLNPDDQQGQILNRKLPEVITNDFKRKPKIESKNVSSRTAASSRKKSRPVTTEFAHTQPVCLPSLRDSMLSSRGGSSVLGSTIATLATGRMYQSCFSRREAKDNEERKEIANKLFWEVADPLGKAREGQFIDQLDTIHNLSTEIDLNDIVTVPDISDYHPFDFESQPNNQGTGEAVCNNENDEDDQNEFNNNNNGNSESNSKNNESGANNENTENNDANNEEKGTKLAVTENYDMYSFAYLRNSSRNINLNEPMIGSYDINKSKTRIVTYLQQHECDFDGDINSSPIYQRLDKIWEELGFTINQKLEMVLKYSKTVEESSKLSEALDAWENAFANIKNYQLTYKNLQTFLTNEALVVPPQKRDMLFAQLNDDLKTAIESVNRSSSYLKSTYGDELLMKRKKVGDLISIRNIKLKMLINKIGIVQQESV